VAFKKLALIAFGLGVDAPFVAAICEKIGNGQKKSEI